MINKKHYLIMLLAMDCMASIGNNNNIEVEVNQSGNIVVLSSDSRDEFNRVLIGEPGFAELKHYKFEIPLKNIQKDEEPKVKDEDKDIDVSSYLIRANALYNAQNYYGALNLVNEVLKKYPNLARAIAMRGSLFMALGEEEKAVKEWQRAFETAPADSSLKIELKAKLPSIK